LCGNAAIASRRNTNGAASLDYEKQPARQRAVSGITPARAFQHAPPQAEFNKLSSVSRRRFPLLRLPDLGSRGILGLHDWAEELHFQFHLVR
jgi:hypothetical protein